MALLYHITNSDDPPHIPEDVSENLREFILSCFKRDPKERPTADLLLLHEFILGDKEVDATGQKNLMMDTMDHFRAMTPSTKDMQGRGQFFGDPSATQSTVDVNYSMDSNHQYQIWMANESGKGGKTQDGSTIEQDNVNFAPLNLAGGHVVENLHEPTENWPAWAKQESDESTRPPMGTNPFATNPLDDAAPAPAMGGPAPLSVSIGSNSGTVGLAMGRSPGGEAYLKREERPLSAAAHMDEYAKEEALKEAKLKEKREKLAQMKREEEEFKRQLQLERENAK